MNESEFKQKCEDILAVEQYIVSLQGYRQKEKLRFREMLQKAWRSLVMLICVLAVVGVLKYAEIQLKNMGGLIQPILYGVIFFKFVGIIWLIMPLLGLNENEGVISFLWQTLTLAFQNKKREEANRKHETEVKLARESWVNIQKDLLIYSYSNAEPNESGEKIRERKFFFDMPFYPNQSENMLMSEKYGITRWSKQLINEELVTDILEGLYGSIKTEKDEYGNLRLDGFSQEHEINQDIIHEIFSDDYLILYADLDRNDLASKEQMKLHKIYEIAARRLKERETYKTIETYDVEKARKDFNNNVDTMLNSDVISIVEANAMREKGEKNLQKLSKPIIKDSHCVCRVVGEELMILEKGYVLFWGNRLLAVCVPKGTVEELHIAYKLDKAMSVDVMDFKMRIPDHKRFHGKIILAESQQVHPNPYSTVQYVVNNLGKYMKPFDGSEEIPDDTEDKTECNIWRYFMLQRFKKDSGKKWGMKECEELVGKPKEEPLPKEYGRKVVFNVVFDVVLFLFFAWGIVSTTDILPEMLRFGPVEKAWKSVTDDEWKFARKVEDLEFDKGCYRSLVNDGTNANIASSDARRSAAVEGDKLWVNDWTGMIWCDKGNIKKVYRGGDNYYYEEQAAPMLNDGELGYAVFLPEEEESYAVVFDREKNEKGYRETVARGWAENYKENDSFTFSQISGQLYSILKKQESEALNPEEMAGLLYFSSKGILLDYQDGTAIFADDMTDLGTVHIYRQSEEGQEELFSYPDDYEGSGAGRFVAENTIFYAERLSAFEYGLEKTEDHWRLMMESDTPILGLNYAYSETYGLNVLALREDRMTMLIPSEARIGDISLEEKYESFYTIENQVLICSGQEGEFNSGKGRSYWTITLN